jgi:adenylate cyclase
MPPIRDQERPKPGYITICLAALGLAALALVLLGPRLQAAVFDTYQRLQTRTLEPSPVTVVLIDDASVDAVGGWPWSRYTVAQLVQEIGKFRPKVIGFDVIYPTADPRNPDEVIAYYPELSKSAAAEFASLPSMDATMADVVARQPVVLGLAGLDDPSVGNDAVAFPPSFASPLPASVRSFPHAMRNIETIENAASAVSVLNSTPDPDSVVRRFAPAFRVGGKDIAALALELARWDAGEEPIEIAASGGGLRGLKLPGSTIPVDDTGLVQIDFGVLPEPEVLSAIDILDGADASELIEGRTVLIGVGALGTSDIVTTPVDRAVYGVLVQAKAVHAYRTGAVLVRHRLSAPIEWSVGLVLAVLVMAVAGRVRQRWALTLPVVIAGLIGTGSWLAYSQAGFLVDPFPPVVLPMATIAAAGGYRFAETIRARLYIHSAFDRFLSPDLVAQIARDPSKLELGGEERDMTVLFCDVRGFSKISEKLTPQQLIQFLIDVLTPLSDILLDRRATIDKYMGDAIVAFWNAPLDDPQHPQNAADAALAMIERLKGLNVEKLEPGAYDWPGEVKIGIGLNTGLVCVGNMGSQQRLNYTMIGDTVNLASRIEGMTKYYGVAIAIGHALASRLPEYALIELDRVQVVGRDEPEQLYALLGDRTMATSTDFIAMRDTVCALHAAYRDTRWSEAEAALDRLDEGEASTFGLARFVELYRERLAAFSEQPPVAPWDGVFKATQK